MAVRTWRKVDFSGGLQTSTSRILRKGNELVSVTNGEFKTLIGAVTRRLGYTQVGDTLRANKPALGAFVHRWNGGSRQFMASNKADDTATLLSYLTGSTWTDLAAVIAPNVRMQAYSHLGEAYVVGADSASVYMDPLNIDTSAGYSASRNLYTAPRSKFIAEYSGQLYMVNCQVNTASGWQTYPDRAYRSSAPTGAITFVKADQSITTTITNKVPTMTGASAPSGTAASSTNDGAGTEAWHAFDTSTAFGWRASTNVGWLSYDFVTPTVINYYSILAMNGAGTQGPKTWTFEGSNDNSSWTVLDTKTTVPAWAVAETRGYEISNTNYYRYYRINVSLNFGDPKLLIIEAKFSSKTSTASVNLDSTRYIKTGMSLDVYTGRTNTVLYTSIAVTAVDKLNNAFSFTPYNLSFATTDITLATDKITLSSVANFPTGTPLKISNVGGVLPNGLSDGMTYYAITSGSDIRLATSAENASANIYVDIVDVGSGTHKITLQYNFKNRNEIWGAGRKDKLSVYWNTDYPTTENADFLRIPQGRDDFAEFTGWAKTTGRLFLFTKNSFYKFDGANFTPCSTTIGSLSHEAIQVIGNWVIFPHYTGLYGYNDATGQLQLLSRGVKSWFKGIPDANWATASAGVIDNVYKLQVGSNVVYQGQTLTGTLRIVYDFDSNNFSTELHTRQHLFQFLQVYSGRLMLHFADDKGKLFVDEVGNTDAGTTIPFVIEQGRENFTIDEIKSYYSAYVYTESPRGAAIKYSVDGKDWDTLGQLERDVQFLRFPEGLQGNDINFEITQHDDGDPVSVIMIVVNFNTEAQAYQ